MYRLELIDEVRIDLISSACGVVEIVLGGMNALISGRSYQGYRYEINV